MDVPSAEEWKRVLDEERANADGFVFLLGAGASLNPELRAEWRLLLRNDLDSKKPLVPIIHVQGSVLHDLPPFLRNRKAIYATGFDDGIADQARILVRQSAESANEGRDQARKEQQKWLKELENYALALREENAAAKATLE